MMGNNGDHRKQEVIEHYLRRVKLLTQLNEGWRQLNEAFRQMADALTRAYKAIPTKIKRKGKYRQN
jgi:uncharacterized membrane-anchored protein YhcB (DUF1043 family)